MNTLEMIYKHHDVDLGEDLDPNLDIPVLDSAQVQGDVMIIPVRPGADLGDVVPPQGVAVVKGENGGNTHLLVGEGVSFRQLSNTDARNLTLGTATVPEGKTAWLLHPEHGANGLAPGCWEFRRQREQSDVIRLVQD